MDDYIKRKKRTGNVDSFNESQPEFVIRESRQEIDNIMSNILKYEARAEEIKKKLQELQLLTTEREGLMEKRLLGESSVQRSELKTVVSDRNTSESTKNISKNIELEGTKGVVDPVGAESALIKSDETSSGKLPSTSKTNGRKRSSRI